jgi:RNA-directed DNA polymerase
MSTDENLMYEWKDLPWKRIERQAFKLQKRIYQASQRAEVKILHRLQRLLLHSRSAKLLATRKVTQDNGGKHTAGVDGVKSLPAKARLALVDSLRITEKAKPVRRIWIPKPGKTEKRALGIPTIGDRILQTLAKFSLEPEWEAKFEANSYGFRPGRSCQDALNAIRRSIEQKPKYVLDADIAQCFDCINHQALLSKVATFPLLRRVLKGWLKAGVMEKGKLFPSEEGTPQGGCISPLLANIALHGMEEVLQKACPAYRKQETGKRVCYGLQLIRYADDLVALHADLPQLLKAKAVLEEWLAPMGLQLKESKTRIAHSLEPFEGRKGFDFLGCSIRQFATGKTYGRRRRDGSSMGFTTLIYPSKESLKKHLAAIKSLIHGYRNAPQEALIGILNPIIRGWANYFACENSSATFSKMDHLLFLKLLSWAKRRHVNKSRRWICHKYWKVDWGKWDFSAGNESRLGLHSEVKIKTHIKVKGNKSPYDGDWLYWATRMATHPQVGTRTGKLLKKQQGKCNWCNLHFASEDQLETDHILPLSKGGKDKLDNLQLLHRHCHHQKTAVDLYEVKENKERCS